jgi:hypothetical protein
MPPQQPMPQQAAPQPQPQQPPQPQQQQQPPQAKPNPIMGLPAMQGPKKMAGGGIIAFNGEKDSEVPKDEEATSSIGDFFRRLVEPPEFLKGRIERAKDIGYAESQVPYPWEAVTPSERARRKQETERVLAGGKRLPETSVPPAVNEDAKKKEGKPDIQNAPDPLNGLAALMQGMGGGRGGGGGGSPKEDNELRQMIINGVPMGPAQKSYMQNVDRLAPQLESSKAPVLSDAETSAMEARKFREYQERSKPHFDMMQKLIDEERAANNAGKESEVYKMLGKMGGALMSSRGAFGPALGHAVGEGIDYNDKVDAARAAAERLRRQAQMDLLKARMADEKDDQKSAQAYIAEHDRKIRDAYRIEQEGKIAALNARGKGAEFENADERSRERGIAALAVSDARRSAELARAAGTQENNMMRLQMALMKLNQMERPTPADKIKVDERADQIFMNPTRSTEAMKYIVSMKELGGDNLLKAVNMGTMKPDDPKFLAVVEAAKNAYKKDYFQGTRTSSGSPGVTMGTDYLSKLSAQ